MKIFTHLSIPVYAVPSESAEILTQEDISNIRKGLPVSSNEIPGWPAGPQLGSECAILMDADSGAILYAKNIDLQKYPASITKVMTCLVAVEKCGLDEMVTFSKNAVFGIDPGSSNCGLDVGQSITLEEALYCIMLSSANEAASGVAEHVGGSVEDFCKLMNERALELGCTGTHFVNANGLPNEEHLTTAHDMALITRAFNQNETLRRIASSKSYTVNATDTQPDTFTLYNHHKMFPGFKYAYEYFTWGKTGYTIAARETLVTCAEKNGMNLIAVVMKGEPPYQYTDTRDLFEYGFKEFSRVNIAENEKRFEMAHADFFNADNDVFGNTEPLIALSPDGYCIVPNNVSLSDLTPNVSYDDLAPDTVAKITYTYGGNYMGEVDVVLQGSAIRPFEFGAAVSENDSPKSVSAGASGFNNPGVVFISMKQILIIAGAVIGALVLILLIIAYLRYRRNSKSRRRRLNKKSRKYFSEFDDFDF